MKRNILHILFFVQAVFVSVSLSAQVPEGYYDAIEGTQKIMLKTALFNIIKGHTELTYGELWKAFEDTDATANGDVWDMYSTCTFTFVEDQDRGSGGTDECQLFNREHSFPKSWFDDEEPMYTDLFHLYPTDKFVNNRRSNYPFGEVSNPTWESDMGDAKLGPNSTPGYTKTVFEPTNIYKGDFARTYFYMVTRYEDVVANWNSKEAVESLAGNSYPAFKQWAVDVLLKWHRNDPVSEKEIDRNNVIYTSYQHNRNPYIDRPELIEYIWGNKMGEVYFSSASGIGAEMAAQNIEIYVSEGAIVLKADRPVQSIHVYDVFGRLVFAGIGEAGINRIEAPAGQFYIVKADETIEKVYVE